jgi:antitoxin (DNA-binding transcriptional repressor) of toxin-antitoxin stability system
MITVNMHEAKTRLSELVQSAEGGEDVVICLAPAPKVRTRRNLKADPSLRARLAPGHDPAEPLSEDEWPSECR